MPTADSKNNVETNRKQEQEQAEQDETKERKASFSPVVLLLKTKANDIDAQFKSVPDEEEKVNLEAHRRVVFSNIFLLYWEIFCSETHSAL